MSFCSSRRKLDRLLIKFLRQHQFRSQHSVLATRHRSLLSPPPPRPKILSAQLRTLNFSLPRHRGIMLRRLCSDKPSQLGGGLTIHTSASVCKSSSCPTLFTFPATQLPLAYASSSSSSSVVRPVMSGSSLSMAASIAARFFSCSRRIFSSTVSRVISL